MKKILVIGALVAAIAISAWAAAPTPHNYSTVKATATITNANVYGGTWLAVDSLIIVASDSANVLITVSGQAVGNPGSKMYMCLDNGSALDTIQVDFPKITTGGMVRMPFAWSRGKSNNGALTDTVYVKMVVGGSSQSDVAYIYDLCLTADVEDQ